ncbi:MAG: HDIG domain-containing metalloprotein [Cyanobacteria bacterium P01_A01_bin.123]
MKLFKLFTQQIDHWWHGYFVIGNRQSDHFRLRRLALQSGLRSNRVGNFLRGQLSPILSSQTPDRSPGETVVRKRCKRQKGVQPPTLFAVAMLTLTASMGQRFYNQPVLQVATRSPQVVIAPDSATVIDEQSTEERRIAARNGALPVFMMDDEANQQTSDGVNNWLEQGDDLWQQAGTVPFVETDQLSTASQQYIRTIDASEWETLLRQVRSRSEPFILPDGIARAQTTPLVLTDLSPTQSAVVRELLTYRQTTSPAAFTLLTSTVERTQRGYRQAIAEIEALMRQNSELPLTPELLELSAADWRQTQRGVRAVVKRMTAQGIAQGLPPDLLERAIRIQVKGEVPAAAEDMAVQLLLVTLQPNLVEDVERTREQAEQVAQAVEPVMVSVSSGEVIVAEGEEITPSDFALLDHFNLSRRRFNWLGFTGFGVLVGGGMCVFLLVENFYHPGLRRRDYGLIVLLTWGAAGVIAVGIPAISLVAVGLLVGSFYGAALGGTVVALLGIILPIGTAVSGIPLAASAAGALVGALVAARLRSREELALLGGAVGVTQGVVHLILTLMLSPVSSAAWLNILSVSALQAVYGIACSIVAIGISPYLEHLFDLVTPIRLAELSNPNRPLLKRLASVAPGTFQHTLFVSSLAEAAARALGCNVELVRAGTLYHDIGKMHDPEGFIENQMGGVNKHDVIDDPWVSSDIIKKHVTKGIEMARKHRLPKALRAFIPEHQGTMPISYFYHQAKERAKADASIVAREQDFRYDGPIPQTPETGIVMLADSCEAALRSLKDATPEEALAMVNKILRARWKDQQLIDSCLTRENMATIAEIFVQVWQQYNHKRIAYPKAALSGRAGG